MIYYQIIDNQSSMLLESLLPNIPTTPINIIVIIVAILGAILLSYGVFLEQERRQDLVKLVGATCLCVYAIYIENAIFIIAMGGLALASAVEFTEIFLGLHKHNKEDLKKYKKLH